MDVQLSYRELSLLVRRQLDHLSAHTLTTERRLLINFVLRFSYDCDKSTAEVPSQACVAQLLGLSAADVCRGERDLLDFGILASVYKQGIGNQILQIYEPQPDSSRWVDEKLIWRIKSPVNRAMQHSQN